MTTFFNSIDFYLSILSIAIICTLPQWNCHVNGTTFQSGLRFQTGLSLLWVSCKHAVRVKMVAPLPSADVKFLLNQKMRPSLSSHLFCEPWSWCIANQSGSAKETVSPNISENIEMFICFICMGTQDRTLIDISHLYQITMNQHKS